MNLLIVGRAGLDTSKKVSKYKIQNTIIFFKDTRYKIHVSEIRIRYKILNIFIYLFIFSR